MSERSIYPPTRRDGFVRVPGAGASSRGRGRLLPLTMALLLASACSLLENPGPESAAEPVAVLPVPDSTAPSVVPLRYARRNLMLEELPEGPGDLVERLRRDFSLPASDDDSVASELTWFASHPDYLARVFTRAERYLFHIAEALEARGMPSDLAFLPIVESAFDPFAYSHGRASGLWQIIPGTGRRLGLRQNWWYDGRRDVIDSTRAALDYLEALHEQFGGDWLLAVAGYNSGEGNVARALRRAEAAGRSKDFWGIRPYLPAETRTYVPRLLALRDLIAAAEDYELSLPVVPSMPHFAIIDTGGQIDMALAAELAGLDTDDLYALNPGVNRWATDPEGPHRLAVPVDRAETFSAALAALGARERVQWTRHRVRSGETLSHLAMRYNTTEEVLREINDLRGNTIVAGNDLTIPHALNALDDYSQSLDERTARQRSRERSGNRRTHTVAAGESFWTISRRYDVGVRELASWNAMAPGDVLNVGRELVVWTAEPVQLTQTGMTGQAQIRRVNYVVRRGDSLYTIASRFRITVNQLLEWNSISANKYLQPGQRLVMYVDVTEQSS